MTARLTYEEPMEEGARLHGWLNQVEGETMLWEGTLAILEKGRGPWYGPSFGAPPEVVGKIRVRLLPVAEGEKGDKGEPSMETQIMVDGEDTDWQAPTKFNLEGKSD